MTDELTNLAEMLYSRELPGLPRSSETRSTLLSEIKDRYPDAEFVGQGYGRIVVWLPDPPHRHFTKTEKQHTHDGIVVKLAFNAADNHDGQQQNGTEAKIWEHGSPTIKSEYLTPVFGSGPNKKWLMMPFRELIPNPALFENKMIEIFGEAPTGDLAAKDSWGLAGDGSIECIDYGRCPITTTADTPTDSNANVPV